MLTKRLREYLEKLFAGVPDSKEANDFKAELMDSLTSKAMDLKALGKSDDEAYQLCVEGLGDISGSINELRGNPIAFIRDKRVWRNFLYGVSFILLCVIVYLSVAFGTGAWGTPAMIIFPSMAGILYVALTSRLLVINLSSKKHYTSGVILASYAVLVTVAAFFIATFAFGLPAGKTWCLFTYIPFLCTAASACTFLFFRKKKIPFALYIAMIITFSVAAYLTIGALVAFHPYWLIIVVGAVLSFLLTIIKINMNLSKKK